MSVYLVIVLIINTAHFLQTGKTSVTYTASKGGVFSMTLTCARELGRYVCHKFVYMSYSVIVCKFRNGIRCNAILPGFIDTPIVATVPQAMKDAVNHIYIC